MKGAKKMNKPMLKISCISNRKTIPCKVFGALLAAIITVLFMQSCVFAYTGTGSQTSPYIITTGEELVELAKAKRSESYIMLKNDIEINEQTGTIEADYKKHIYLNGHTINCTKPSMFRLYSNGVASYTYGYIDFNGGTINIDIPEQTYTPTVFSVDYGHLVFNNVTINAVMHNNNSVLISQSTRGQNFFSQSSLQFNNCTINNNTENKGSIAIKSRPVVKMKNTVVNTNENGKSYAFVIDGRMPYYDIINTTFNGKMSITGKDDSEAENNLNSFTNAAANSELYFARSDDHYEWISADIKAEMPYNNYKLDVMPVIDTQPQPVEATVGDNIYFKIVCRHVESMDWALYTKESDGSYKAIKKSRWVQEGTESFNQDVYTEETLSGTATLKFSGAGGWLDGLYVGADLNCGAYTLSSDIVPIKMNKRTIEKLNMHDFVLPTHGSELDTTITFDNNIEPCIKEYTVYFIDKNSSFKHVYTEPLVGGTSCYVWIDITLKSDAAQFKNADEDKYTCDLKWYGSKQPDVTEIMFSVFEDNLTAIYDYTVPVANEGAGVLLERVNTGVDAPVVGEQPSSSAWSTGAYVSRGYTVKSVDWTPSHTVFKEGQDYTALFSIQADAGYYISEETLFYINDTAVTPKEIIGSGAGNSALVALKFASAGDINADGSVDDIDAKLLLWHMSGIMPLTGEELKRADMDNDNSYDLTDVIKMLKNKQ